MFQVLLAVQANSLSMLHPDYSILAARLFVARIYKVTPKSFSQWVRKYGTGASDVGLLRPLLI